MYIPIGHVLMQTEKYEGYQVVMNWVVNTYGLKPKFLTTDFEPALIRSAKEAFPNAMLVP